MRWNELCDDPCPVARGLSVIGDRWTLLVLRECFRGARRFERFQEKLGITRHVLADRLRKLESEGVLRRVPYQERPLRHEYRLTDKGKALHDVLLTLMTWADAYAPCEGGGPVTIRSRKTGEPVAPILVDANSGERLDHRAVYSEWRDADPDTAEASAKSA